MRLLPVLRVDHSVDTDPFNPPVVSVTAEYPIACDVKDADSRWRHDLTEPNIVLVKDQPHRFSGEINLILLYPQMPEIIDEQVLVNGQSVRVVHLIQEAFVLRRAE